MDCARVIRGIHSIASASSPAPAYASMTSRRRRGSSAPTSSAPCSAPASDFGSGPSTARMMLLPFSASFLLAILAPAASKSVSGTEARSPAPVSTATSAPRAMNFFTVSGIAAQRVSSAASLRTAIFISRIELLQNQKNDEADDEAEDGAPLHHVGEPLI